MSLMQTFRDGPRSHWRQLWREVWRLLLALGILLCIVSAAVNYAHDHLQAATYSAVVATWLMIADLGAQIRALRS